MKRGQVLPLLAVVALLGAPAALAQGAFAYLPFKMTNSAADPFPWYLDARFGSPAGLAIAQVQVATTAAWKTWNDVSCALPKTTFVGPTTGVVPNPPDAYDVYNTMSVWATSPSDPHFQNYLFGIPDILAMAVPVSYAGVLQTCDVYLNAVNFQWSVASPTASGVMDLQSVLTHEFGHCLGLDHHFFNATDVMQTNINMGVERRVLTVADVGSLCARYPVAGAVGAPCFGDGGCSATGAKCVTQTVNSTLREFCTIGCQLGSGFVCDLPLACKAATAFTPTFTGACLWPDGSETRVGMACSNNAVCGSSLGVCQPPFQGVSGTTFWQAGYCMQDCSAGKAPCPGGSLCTNLSAGNDFCLQQCRVGLADCRPGYSCAQTSQGGVCVPECLNDVDCGDVNNYVCRTCDGLCIAKQNAAGQVGDVCTSDAQCGAGQLCLSFSSTNATKICSLGCARGCGTCPTGSACFALGPLQELYCLRTCQTGTCPAGEQCGQLSSGRGCVPSCRFNSDCPVGTECNFGECVVLGGDDSGCPFCPVDDGGAGGGGGGSRRDAGTGGGGTGTCGCSGAPAQSLGLATLLLFIAMRRRTWPSR